MVLVGYIMRTTSNTAQLIWGAGVASSSAVSVGAALEGINTDDDVVLVMRGTTPDAPGDLTFQAAFLEYLP
jgi:hypothetical protein